ncbi:hypothetical protein F4821DRAFT_119001 [Hypoxylon rubiginosum]|uniref:Uncharacterized protein n=1 Tax=Hypoxylon rubiginosum TaxID=110542 RepID=A0ACC0D2Z1_9PEZI|nr:hypothetical protein F4821DRAFT_119001 [Hypoxylon rubiginosum]
MNNSDLSQITSGIPDFIGGLPKRGRPKVPAPQDEFDQYFDYKRFYEGTPAADADSRSRSDASSIPGLTSGPSEEDGAPSPRSTEDAFHYKEAVAQIKQHDDRFTLPTREIRPNGVSYPWHMEIDNTLASSGADAQGFGSSSGGSSPLSPASSSAGASSSSQNSSSCDSSHSRGKRHRPLENPEKVAQMRKLGACFRCKTRKINCDQDIPCARCKNDAAKFCNDDGGELAERMCFRKPSTTHDLAFQAIWRMTANSPPTSQRGNAGVQRWNVYFQPNFTAETLVIPVSHNEGFTSNNGPGRARWDTNQAHPHQYVLRWDSGLEDRELISWASRQMLKDERHDFQSALDVLICRSAELGHFVLPHFDLVCKVRDMMCLYKIWRHEKFFFQRFPGSLEELPSQICQSLKRTIAFRMKSIESDILAQFWRTPDSGLKPQERLPLWTCMMQFILMYRDIHDLSRSEVDFCGDRHQIQSVTMSLFSNLVVMCENCFGKKKPEAIVDDGNFQTSAARRQLNDDFRTVEGRRDDFCT